MYVGVVNFTIWLLLSKILHKFSVKQYLLIFYATSAMMMTSHMAAVRENYHRLKMTHNVEHQLISEQCNTGLYKFQTKCPGRNLLGYTMNLVSHSQTIYATACAYNRDINKWMVCIWSGYTRLLHVWTQAKLWSCWWISEQPYCTTNVFNSLFHTLCI